MRGLLLLGIITLVPAHAFAVGGTVVRHGARLLTKEAAEQSAKTVAKETAEQAAKVAAQRVTSATARRAAATAAKHFGDDLAHMSTKLGSRLTSTQQRRLAILSKNMTPAAKKQLLTNASKSTHAGSFVDDLWRHRGKIAVAGTAATGAVTVMTHGDDIANAAAGVATSAIESALAPLAQAFASLLWWVVPIALLVGVFLCFQQAIAIAFAQRVRNLFRRMISAARG